MKVLFINGPLPPIFLFQSHVESCYIALQSKMIFRNLPCNDEAAIAF